MSDIPTGIIIGLFEWDGSIDPTIIMGRTREAVEREAVKVLMYTDADSPTPRFPFILDGPADRWLDEHPYPDLDDAVAVRAWLDALADVDDLRPATEFNVWTNYTIA